MKTKVLTFAAAVALCAACVRKSPPPEDKRADAGPVLTVDQPIHDFGAVTDGQKLRHTFVVSNNATTPLGFTRTETNAPWVTAELKNRQIPPGGKVEVDVSVDTSGREGDIEKRITLVPGNESLPKLQLYVRAHVSPLIGVEEGEESEEDEFVHMGEVLTRDFKIVGAKAASAKLAVQRTTSPDVTAELIGAGDGGVPILRVTVHPTELGHFHGGVFLSTGLEAKPEIKHFFEWVALGNVTVDPRALHFEKNAEARPSGDTEKVVVLRSRFEGFQVRSAKSTTPAFRAEVRTGDKPREVALHVAVADLASFAKTDIAAIELATNDKVEPTIRVPITVSRSRAKAPRPSASGR